MELKCKKCGCMVINYGVDSNRKIQCPICSEEMIEEHEKYHRMLSIIIEKVIGINSNFSLVAAEALRDYADLIEETEGGEKCYKFTSKNGCKIKMIHGLECPIVSQ